MGEVVQIHKHPELMDACCALLNSEWPRNYNMRLDALRSSSDELPCSLVLLGEDGGERQGQVLGHLRLGLVLESEEACSVKSVVIRKDCRKMGLGKSLMFAAEEYARSLGFVICYLSTIDQQEFYRRLGYQECEPVYFLTAGRSSMNTQMISQLSKGQQIRTCVSPPHKDSQITKVRATDPNSPPAPPRPPPPPPKTVQRRSQSALESVTFMRKML